MKNLLLSSISVVALSSACAMAAEGHSSFFETEISETDALVWSGFNAGINTGYAGSFGQVTSDSLDFSSKATSNDSFTWRHTNDYEQKPVTQGYLANILTGSPNIVGVSQSNNGGSAHINQNGFIGGAQIGYNWLVRSNIAFFLLGLETDFQGSTLNGKSTRSGAGPIALQQNFQSQNASESLATASCGAADGEGSCYLVTGNSSSSSLGFGGSSLSVNLSSLGTARGKLGIVLSKDIYVYGTAGLAYGQVNAQATNYLATNSRLSNSTTTTSYFAYDNTEWTEISVSSGNSVTAANAYSQGAGSISTTKFGWTAGAGAEWMFMHNWSIKGECLYYSLGNVRVTPTQSIVATNGGATPVILSNYQQASLGGVIARLGINYHFSFESPSSAFKL
jgi:outer membrane immunogenic protein